MHGVCSFTCHFHLGIVFLHLSLLLLRPGMTSLHKNVQSVAGLVDGAVDSIAFPHSCSLSCHLPISVYSFVAHLKEIYDVSFLFFQKITQLPDILLR